MDTNIKEKNLKISMLLFPDKLESIDELEVKYPLRNLPLDTIVTRVAPSPTGFVHIGTLIAALIPERFAHQTDQNGVFILRIEDTDKKRELEGGIDLITNALKNFNIDIDEGVISNKDEEGDYSPYTQSKRLNTYYSTVKYLIENDYAYPCFCTSEELNELRKIQEKEKVRPGYYGKYAKHREITSEEVEENIKNKKPFVIRIKAKGRHDEKISYTDLIRGKLELSANDIDYVLIKSDRFPTYHLANLVDDHFMRVNLVLRGSEWIPSTSLHLQVYKYLDWKIPSIGHFSPIMKMDGNSKRKLSKRKDPEADIAFYSKEGFPKESIIEYLLNLINSNFEDWRRQNPETDYKEFKINLSKLNISGALFNMTKLEDVSKQVVAKMPADEVYKNVITWTQMYDPDFAEILVANMKYTLDIFNIEKDIKGKRKDIYKWSQLKEYFGYFYDDIFNRLTKDEYNFPKNILKEDQLNILKGYIATDNADKPKVEWFGEIRQIAEKYGFAIDMKLYKENTSRYKGSVSDVATVLRVALTNKTNTPDLQEILRVMGKSRVKDRLQAAIDSLNN